MFCMNTAALYSQRHPAISANQACGTMRTKWDTAACVHGCALWWRFLHNCFWLIDFYLFQSLLSRLPSARFTSRPSVGGSRLEAVFSFRGSRVNSRPSKLRKGSEGRELGSGARLEIVWFAPKGQSRVFEARSRGEAARQRNWAVVAALSIVRTIATAQSV